MNKVLPKYLKSNQSPDGMQFHNEHLFTGDQEISHSACNLLSDLDILMTNIMLSVNLKRRMERDSQEKYREQIKSGYFSYLASRMVNTTANHIF